MKTLYVAEARSTGDGRNGKAWTSDQKLDLELSMPESLGGSGDGTNPEQLFAVGYAACFHNALLLVGRRRKASMAGSSVDAAVELGLTDAQEYQLAVALRVTIPDVSAAVGAVLVEEAHAMCPYSRATRGNIDVSVSIVGG